MATTVIQGRKPIRGDADVSNVLDGKTFSAKVGNLTRNNLTGTMPNRAGDTAALASSVSGTTLKLRASDGYRDGIDDNVTITDADFVDSNIPNDKNIFGLQGTMQSYASWVNISVTANVATANSRQRILTTTTSVSVGSPIKYGTNYGVVMHVSGDNKYVWFSSAGTPTATGTYQYGGVGAYPSDFPDITPSNWRHTIDSNNYSRSASSTSWIKMSSDYGMPLGSFRLHGVAIGITNDSASGLWRVCDTSSAGTSIGIDISYTREYGSNNLMNDEVDINYTSSTTLALYYYRESTNTYSLTNYKLTCMPNFTI